MTNKKKKMSRNTIRWGLLLIFILLINFIPLPYYFTMPGEAKVLSEVIEVEDGYDYEGTFMLTTIRMGKANIVNYIWAQFDDDRELMPEKQVRPQGESDEEYRHRQLMIMDKSQENAIIVAYDRAGKYTYYENQGVIVTSIIPGMDADEKLKVGDRIVKVGDVEVLETEQLLDILGEYEIGEFVPLTVERDGETVNVSVEVLPFPKEIGEGKGIGIANPMTERYLKMDPEVHIDTAEIGGPSAGLMFALEIYNQLVEEDITKGYHIAGTGTIDVEGKVGRIGGVHQKVVAAHEAGAEIFFAPNENGAANSNYEIAKQKAKEIGTAMEVVPVDTFEDALNYLKSLPKK